VPAAPADGIEPDHPGDGGGPGPVLDRGVVSGDGFLPFAIGMTPPAVLERVDPRYTESARRARRQGIVVLQLRIGATGEVVTVGVLKSLGFGLDEEAERAVRQWRFAPARRNGQAVGVVYTITVRYELR
jgi:TonB family protein